VNQPRCVQICVIMQATAGTSHKGQGQTQCLPGSEAVQRAVVPGLRHSRGPPTINHTEARKHHVEGYMTEACTRRRTALGPVEKQHIQALARRQGTQ
jgi:hypothetical protein